MRKLMQPGLRKYTTWLTRVLNITMKLSKVAAPAVGCFYANPLLCMAGLNLVAKWSLLVWGWAFSYQNKVIGETERVALCSPLMFLGYVVSEKAEKRLLGFTPTILSPACKPSVAFIKKEKVEEFSGLNLFSMKTKSCNALQQEMEYLKKHIYHCTTPPREFYSGYTIRLKNK